MKTDKDLEENGQLLVVAVVTNHLSNLEFYNFLCYNISIFGEKNTMKRITQKTFNQAGIIILTNGKQVPYYRGEDPFIVIKIINKEVEVESIFACFDPVEFNEKLKQLADIPYKLRVALRTGFENVECYGYNNYIDKSIYA